MKLILSAFFFCISSLAFSDNWKDTSPHTITQIKVEKDVSLEILDWGGEGTPLVFLAGIATNAHTFDALAPQFTKSHRVIGITRRGHGNSSWPDSGYDVPTLANDTISVLQSLKLNNVILVGHSGAGLELTEIATEKPRLVKGLIYLDAIQDYLYSSYLSCTVTAEFNKVVVSSFANPEAHIQTQKKFNQAGEAIPFFSNKAVELIVKNDKTYIPDYSKIKAPALAITHVWEHIDDVFLGEMPFTKKCRNALQKETFSGINRFVTQIPDGEAVSISKSQHMIYLTTPKKVEHYMKKWLTREFGFKY